MKRQNGSSLIMTIIALAIMFIAIMAYLQSTDTATLVAGNFSFKTIANNAAEIGIDQAIDELNAQTNSDTAIAGQYSPIQLTSDTNGLPANLNWGQVPITTVNSNYSVQHFTERLCTRAPVENANTQCIVGQLAMPSSNKLGAPVYYGTNAIYYKVTVRVGGPKNTLTFVQAILAKQRASERYIYEKIYIDIFFTQLDIDGLCH